MHYAVILFFRKQINFLIDFGFFILKFLPDLFFIINNN